MTPSGQFKREGVDADADPKSGIPFMERIWRVEPDEDGKTREDQRQL
jgi:hypothetical protein